MYRTTDKLRNQLNTIYQNYDLDTIEDKFKSAKRTETWAEGFMVELVQYFNVLDSFMTCALCQKKIKKEE